MDTTRRNFLTLGGAAALAVGFSGESRAAEQSAVEKENERIVNEFCATWETMDVEKLGSFMADTITFRMIEGAPMVEGKEALMNGIRDFLANAKSARFEMIRSHAMGNMVINERIDHFERPEQNDAFHITGFFLVKNGKIQEWRDYMMPQA